MPTLGMLVDGGVSAADPDPGAMSAATKHRHTAQRTWDLL
jgi:hypothetical protein